MVHAISSSSLVNYLLWQLLSRLVQQIEANPIGWLRQRGIVGFICHIICCRAGSREGEVDSVTVQVADSITERMKIAKTCV